MSATTELLGTIAATGDDTAKVTFERHYDTDAADLWSAVTTPERLRRWFAPVAGDLRPGGTFTIHFNDGDVPKCTLETCDAPRAFSWVWPHDGQTSHIAVTVATDGAGSRLRLVHSRLPKDKAPEYGAGWQAFVRSLDTHLTADTDPREGAWWEEFHAVRGGYAEALAEVG
jgi:uncharacterized protein YndB with AHSA1/START domain